MHLKTFSNVCAWIWSSLQILKNSWRKKVIFTQYQFEGGRPSFKTKKNLTKIITEDLIRLKIPVFPFISHLKWLSKTWLEILHKLIWVFCAVKRQSLLQSFYVPSSSKMCYICVHVIELMYTLINFLCIYRTNFPPTPCETHNVFPRYQSAYVFVESVYIEW